MGQGNAAQMGGRSGDVAADLAGERRAQHVLRDQHPTALGDEETLGIGLQILPDLQPVRYHAALIENAARDFAMPADSDARQ